MTDPADRPTLDTRRHVLNQEIKKRVYSELLHHTNGAGMSLTTACTRAKPECRVRLPANR